MAPEIYEAEFLGNVYYFGYKFKDSATSKIRSDFIHWLKGLKETKPTDYQYREIIAKPLRVLDKLIGLKNFSLFVYPVSNRSTLVQKIIETCGMMMQRDLRGISAEMVKNLPIINNNHEKDLLIQSDKILLVDDVNTTGAALSEIIRIIRNINVEAEIYVFTLLGK